MCGFVGFASNTKIKDLTWLSKSNESLRHRGPDASGEWFSDCKRVGFAHSRLSIVDLSLKATQPYLDRETGYVIAFNGEIYNHQYIRNILVSQGVIFHSKSDTEVLLKSYIKWGADCLSKLRGMFAFAIFDPRKELVFLARDPVGEKPLYFYSDNKKFIFSSELRAILKCPFVNRNLNWDVVDVFLTMGYVPGEDTLVERIYKLPPAHAMTYSYKTDKVEKWKYWTLPPVIEERKSIVEQNDLVVELEDLLEKSISQQLEADVKVGVLLSGGLDSSIITALASRYKDKLMTFTVGFSEDPQFDESHHADLIANHFSTNHHLIQADLGIDKVFEKLSMEFDEPIIDSSIIPTYLISQFVSQKCKVVLGGDGGDELFGGYAHYSRLNWLRKKINILPFNLRSPILGFIANRMNTGSFGSNINNWISAAGLDLKNELPIITRYFSKTERNNLLKNHKMNAQKGEETFFKNVYKAKSIVESATRTDFQTYLPEDLLVKVDRASMLNSLEIRSPFLNLDLVEFAFSKVPDFLKAENSNKKILLKDLGRKVLPEKFNFNRKQGFSIPLKLMFSREPLKSLIEDTLLSKNSIFNKQTIENLFILNKKGYANSESLFGLLMLQMWINNYDIKV